MSLDFVVFPALDLLSLIFLLSPVFLKLCFHKLLINEYELKCIQLLIPQVNHLNGLYFIYLIKWIFCTFLICKTTLTSYSKKTP